MPARHTLSAEIAEVVFDALIAGGEDAVRAFGALLRKKLAEESAIKQVVGGDRFDHQVAALVEQLRAEFTFPRFQEMVSLQTAISPGEEHCLEWRPQYPVALRRLCVPAAFTEAERCWLSLVVGNDVVFQNVSASVFSDLNVPGIEYPRVLAGMDVRLLVRLSPLAAPATFTAALFYDRAASGYQIGEIIPTPSYYDVGEPFQPLSHTETFDPVSRIMARVRR